MGRLRTSNALKHALNEALATLPAVVAGGQPRSEDYAEQTISGNRLGTECLVYQEGSKKTNRFQAEEGEVFGRVHKISIATLG